MPGFTAYVGMRLIGQPKAGETVVVVAASGPVGSLVGQLAQLAGARAVGIAGGAEKCAYIRRELGFDAVVDRRAGGLSRALARACPDEIDVYFESVGGPVWQAVLPLLNRYARVPVCGLIAFYNGVPRSNRDMLPATMMTIVRRSLLVQGYINTEFVADHYADFLREVGALVASGRFRYREDIVEGLEAAPRRSSECCPAETSESSWFVLGEARRAQGFFVLAIRSYSAPIRSAVCLAVRTAGAFR